MRVLFVNPPVIRSEKSSPENDFKLGAIPLYPWLRKIPGMPFLWRQLGIGRGIRYGVRAEHAGRGRWTAHTVAHPIPSSWAMPHPWLQPMVMR